MPLRLALVVLLIAALGTTAAEPKPLGRIALWPNSRIEPRSAFILADADGRYVFALGSNRWNSSNQLNVIRTSDWTVVGKAGVPELMSSRLLQQSPPAAASYDAKACQLSIVTAEKDKIDFPTDRRTLDDLSNEYRPAKTTKLKEGDGLLPGSREFSAAVRIADRFGLMGFADDRAELELVAIAPALDGVTPARKLKLPRGRFSGDRDGGISHIGLSSDGAVAVVAVSFAYLDPEPPGKELELKDKSSRSCVLFVDVEKMALTGGVNVDAPALKCSVTNSATTVAAVGSEDGKLQFIDLKKRQATGKCLQLTRGMPLANLCFSPDGKYLVAVSNKNGEVGNVLEVATQKSIFTGQLAGQQAVVGLAFSPKGDRLYALTYLGDFYAWDFTKFVMVPGK